MSRCSLRENRKFRWLRLAGKGRKSCLVEGFFPVVEYVEPVPAITTLGKLISDLDLGLDFCVVIVDVQHRKTFSQLPKWIDSDYLLISLAFDSILVSLQSIRTNERGSGVYSGLGRISALDAIPVGHLQAVVGAQAQGLDVGWGVL